MDKTLLARITALPNMPLSELKTLWRDVYEHEPTVHADLMSLPQVVLLPHMGSGTTETREAMGMRALANIEAFLNNQPLPDLVTG